MNYCLNNTPFGYCTGKPLKTTQERVNITYGLGGRQDTQRVFDVVCSKDIRTCPLYRTQQQLYPTKT